MDISQIVTIAFSFSAPFLLKSGEAIAEKLGEDVWTLLKSPFSEDSEKQLIENVETEPLNPENRLKLQNAITLKLEQDEVFFNSVKEKVESVQNELLSNSAQNINNFGGVGKQINIKDNFGTIQM